MGGQHESSDHLVPAETCKYCTNCKDLHRLQKLELGQFITGSILHLILIILEQAESHGQLISYVMLKSKFLKQRFRSHEIFVHILLHLGDDGIADGLHLLFMVLKLVHLTQLVSIQPLDLEFGTL